VTEAGFRDSGRPGWNQVSTRTFRILFALVLIATASIVIRGVWADAALETHEIFVAQTTREMVSAGEMIVPRFGGEPRLQKPPLMYWSVAAVALAAGQRDIPAWVARTPSALATVVLVAACVGIGVRVYDRTTGILGGAMAGFGAGAFEYGVNARPEMVYAACTAVATLGFVSATRMASRRASLGWAMIGWVACGLAILTKGPQLPLLILVGLSGWHVWSSGWRRWREDFRPAIGLGIVSLVVAPWVIAVGLRIDGALALWMREMIGMRFASEGGVGLLSWLVELATPEYLAYAVLTLLPWGVLLPLAFFVAWGRHRPDLACGRDLFFAMVVPLVVLSLATRSREYYLLPVMPIMAVLMARGVLDVIDKAGRSVRTRRIVQGVLVVLAMASVALVAGVEIASDLTVQEAARVVAGFLIAGCLALWASTVIFRRQRIAQLMVTAFAAWSAAFTVMGRDTVLQSDRSERIEALAIAAAQAAGDSVPVVSIGFDRDDLIYQVNRPIRRVPTGVPLAELSTTEPLVLVGAPKVLDRLVAEGARIERGRVFEISDGERFEVAVLAGVDSGSEDPAPEPGPHPSD